MVCPHCVLAAIVGLLASIPIIKILVAKFRAKANKHKHD
jgi:hypothetical protein